MAIGAAASLPGVHLVVAGDGPRSHEVTERAAALDVLERVHIVGGVASPDRLVAAADVIVISSDTEGVPGVLIEGGLSGTPAAATAVGFVDEVVLDGLTGRLARPGDSMALAAAVADVLAERHRYGAAARVHCLRRFDEGVVVDQWEAFLNSRIAGRP